MILVAATGKLYIHTFILKNFNMIIITKTKKQNRTEQNKTKQKTEMKMYRNYSSLVGLGLSEQVQGKPVYSGIEALISRKPSPGLL